MEAVAVLDAIGRQALQAQGDGEAWTEAVRAGTASVAGEFGCEGGVRYAWNRGEGRSATTDVVWTRQGAPQVAVEIHPSFSVSRVTRLADLGAPVSVLVVREPTDLAQAGDLLRKNGRAGFADLPFFLLVVHQGLGRAEGYHLGHLLEGDRGRLVTVGLPGVVSPLEWFPHPVLRGGQRDLLRDCWEAFSTGRNLVASAPTGLGKTVSALAPAVRWAVANDGKVLFLTSKQSQHKMAVDTVRAIRGVARRRPDADGVVSLVDIIAKQSMCPRPEASFSNFAEFCRKVTRARTCRYVTTANAAVRRDLLARPLHVQESVEHAASALCCPHKAAVEAGVEATVVVLDYNHLFSDTGQQVLAKVAPDLSRCVVVIDEAHNLPARIRENGSGRLTLHGLNSAVKEAREAGGTELASRLQQLVRIFEDLLKKAPAGESPMEVGALMEPLRDALQRSLEPVDLATFLGDLRDAADEAAGERGRSALAGIAEFLAGWGRYDRGVLRLVRKADQEDGRRARGPWKPAAGEVHEVRELEFRLLDPSLVSAPVLRTARAAVLMSGTLQPPEIYADLLGLDPAKTTSRAYPSPFPPGNRETLIDRGVTTLYRQRTDDQWSAFADRIAAVAGEAPGNVAVFSPSYEIQDRILQRCGRLVAGKRVLIEDRAMDKTQKEALQAALVGQGGGHVLFGILGGSLAEGVDYPDNALSAVIVVGVPFAPPSLEVDALVAYYKERFGPERGWLMAYLTPAFTKVLQAAGRLIRSETDRGVVVLLDSRFAERRYAGALPEDLAPDLTDDVAAACRAFFRSPGHQDSSGAAALAIPAPRAAAGHLKM